MKTLLKAVFGIAGKPFDVSLNDEEIVWSPKFSEKKGSKKKQYAVSTRSLKLLDLIGAMIKKRKSLKSPMTRGELVGVAVFTYSKNKDRTLSETNMVLECTDEDSCQHWVTAINDKLKSFPHRPKMLKVIINPYSKKGKAPHVYYNSVSKLFHRAGIRTDIMLTERAGHAWDYLRSATDLSSYDGVVCVGGDGIVHEVVNGILENTHAMEGLDVTCEALPEDFKAITPDMRIGIIPAGSTDVIAFSGLGTNDPTTAAINIALGPSQSLDICSLESANRLVRFAFSLAYGFLGDVLKSSEQSRWLGPKRYKWAAVKRMCRLKSYEVEINYLVSTDTESHPRDEQRCRRGCKTCEKPDATDEKIESGEWQTFRGPVVGVSLITLPSPCDISPDGASPCCHLGDGYTDMIIVRACTTAEMYAHVQRNFNRKDQFDFDFVNVHRIKQCYIRAISDPEQATQNESNNQSDSARSRLVDGRAIPLPRKISRHPSGVWNVDGELLEEPSLLVRVHRKLITVFGQGIEDIPETKGCF